MMYFVCHDIVFTFNSLSYCLLTQDTSSILCSRAFEKDNLPVSQIPPHIPILRTWFRYSFLQDCRSGLEDSKPVSIHLDHGSMNPYMSKYLVQCTAQSRNSINASTFLFL